MAINPYFVHFRSEDGWPSYEEFYENVIRKNVACLFDQQLTADWPSRQEWYRDGRINFSLLHQRYGSFPVPVYNCNKKYFNSNPKQEMMFSEFLNYWEKRMETNDSQVEDLWYLKDWHLAQDSHDADFYCVPIYFESDYLNEYCISNGMADYRFTYMGPKGTNTPLHTDVFGSFSWSANVCGRKKWLMIPLKSRLERLLGTKHLPHDLYDLPNHAEIIKQTQGFEIIQEAGQVIFVPSGFLHQVSNLDDTISINHNWFNACNLNMVYENLMEAFSDVQNEIADLKMSPVEWGETCDRIMTIHFGMNLKYFLQILRHIANRLVSMSAKETKLDFRHRTDIECIKTMLAEKIFTNKNFDHLITEQDWDLLSRLESVLL